MAFQEHGGTGQSLFQNDYEQLTVAEYYTPSFNYNRAYDVSYIYKNSARALYDGFCGYASFPISGGPDNELWSSTGNWRKVVSRVGYGNPTGKLVLDPGELGTLTFKIPYDITERYDGDVTDPFYAEIIGGPNPNNSLNPTIFKINDIYCSGIDSSVTTAPKGIIKYNNIERDMYEYTVYEDTYGSTLPQGMRFWQARGLCRVDYAYAYYLYGTKYLTWGSLFDIESDFSTIHIEVLANPSGFEYDYFKYLHPLTNGYSYTYGSKHVPSAVQVTIEGVSVGNSACNKTCVEKQLIPYIYDPINYIRCGFGFICNPGIVYAGDTTSVYFDRFQSFDGTWYASDESPIQCDVLSMLPAYSHDLNPAHKYYCCLDNAGSIILVRSSGNPPADGVPKTYVALYSFYWGSGIYTVDNCITVYPNPPLKHTSVSYNPDCDNQFEIPAGFTDYDGRHGIQVDDFAHEDMCVAQNGTYILSNTHKFTSKIEYYNHFTDVLDDYHCWAGCTGTLDSYYNMVEPELYQRLAYSLSSKLMTPRQISSNSYCRGFTLYQSLHHPTDSGCWSCQGGIEMGTTHPLEDPPLSGIYYTDATLKGLVAGKEYGYREGFLDDVFLFEETNGNAQLSGGVLTFTNVGKYLNSANGPVAIFDLPSNTVTFSGVPNGVQYAYIGNDGIIKITSSAPNPLGFDGQRYIAQFYPFPTGLSCNVGYSLQDLRVLFDSENTTDGIVTCTSPKYNVASRYIGFDSILYCYDHQVGMTSGTIYFPQNLLGSGILNYGVDGKTGEFRIFNDWTNIPQYLDLEMDAYDYNAMQGLYFMNYVYESPKASNLTSPTSEKIYPAGTKLPRPSTYFNLDEFNIEYVPYERYKGKDLVRISPTGDYFRIFNNYNNAYGYYEKETLYYKLYKPSDKKDYTLSFNTAGALVVGSGRQYLPVVVVRTTGNYEIFDYRPKVSGNGMISGFVNDGYSLVNNGYDINGDLKKTIMVDPDSKLGYYSFYENNKLYKITDPIDWTYSKDPATYGIHYFSGGNLCFYDYPNYKFKTQNEMIDDIGDMVIMSTPVYHSGELTMSTTVSSYAPIVYLAQEAFTKTEVFKYPMDFISAYYDKYGNPSYGELDSCNFNNVTITVTPL